MADTALRTVFVTGAGRGIGRAIAERLAADGFAVAIDHAGSREAAYAVWRASSDAAGGRAVALQADIADETQAAHPFGEAERELGAPLDVLVNNAGVMPPEAAIADAALDDLDRNFAVNVRRTCLCPREAARRIRCRLLGRRAGAVHQRPDHPQQRRRRVTTQQRGDGPAALERERGRTACLGPRPPGW